MSIIKEEGDETAGSTIYIKFSGEHNNIYYQKENTKEIVRHKGIPKYRTKNWDIS